jgi:hypothetical protein
MAPCGASWDYSDLTMTLSSAQLLPMQLVQLVQQMLQKRPFMSAGVRSCPSA